jgi:hypothetical protein
VAATFALAAGNTNPQGIADPPPPEMLLTSVASSFALNQLPVQNGLMVADSERGPALGLDDRDDRVALFGNAIPPIRTSSLLPERSETSVSASLVSQDSMGLIGLTSALQTGLAQPPGSGASDGSWSSSHAAKLAVTDYLFSEEPLWHASLAEAASSRL